MAHSADEHHCPHLLFLSANLSRCDPFVTNTIKHLIKTAEFIAAIGRCSIFDLRDTDHRGLQDTSATHWSTMLLWDSTLAVSNLAIDRFQAFIKHKTSLMPVFVWIYVNPELVRNRKQRKRAVGELVKICMDEVFKPLQSDAIWTLEIFGLEKVKP